MTIWTPATFIRVKVLGLAWRGDELLLGEVADSAGRVKGVRPLGGCIEFGETREQALCREFDEELGCGIMLTGPWHGFENIFEHEGAIGHEFLFAANIGLGDATLYDGDHISYLEDDGLACRASWLSPTKLADGVGLYPESLGPLIDAGVISPRG